MSRVSARAKVNDRALLGRFRHYNAPLKVSYFSQFIKAFHRGQAIDKSKLDASIREIEQVVSIIRLTRFYSSTDIVM